MSALKLIGSRRECRQGCNELAARWRTGPTQPSRRRERLNYHHLGGLLADAWGIDSHCAKKLVCPRGETVYQQARHVRRVAGFVLHALLSPAAAKALGERELPRLRRLMTDGARYSRTGLTYYPSVDADRLVESGQSPGSWDRWIGRVLRRATVILAPWGTYPSYAAVQEIVRSSQGRDGKFRMPRAHRAAVKVAAVTLTMRFGMPPNSQGHYEEAAPGGIGHYIRGLEPAVSLRDARAVLIAFRLFRQQSESTLLPLVHYETSGQQLRDALDRDFGVQGDDDRIMASDYQVVCWSKRGAVLAQPLSPRGTRRGINDMRRIVQVVVSDPANGHRHHLTVPSFFALPLRQGESASRRVHAAVAWTFGMTPDEYRPAKEA